MKRWLPLLLALFAIPTVFVACTHGGGVDDPDHEDPKPPKRMTAALGTPPPWACVTAGPRVETILLTPPNSLGITVDQVRSSMAEANAYINDAAAPSGASMKLLCDGAAPKVHVISSAIQCDDFDCIVNAVRAVGHTQPEVRYAIFYNSHVSAGWGGMGHVGSTTDPGPFYGITFGYPGGFIILHELAHTLGAVWNAAPGSDQGAHCLISYDVLCYGGQQQIVCPTAHEFDCGKNKYANLNPPAGSFLADNPGANLFNCKNLYFQINLCGGTTPRTFDTLRIDRAWITAAPYSYAKVRLTWNPAQAVSTNVGVWRRDNGGTWARVYTTLNDGLFTQNLLKRRGVFDYKLRDLSNGRFSNVVTATLR